MKTTLLIMAAGIGSRFGTGIIAIFNNTAESTLTFEKK